jgi:hypothetical protein
MDGQPLSRKDARKKRKLERQGVTPLTQEEQEAVAAKKQKRKKDFALPEHLRGAGERQKQPKDAGARVAELLSRQLQEGGHDVGGSADGAALGPTLHALGKIALEMSHQDGEFCQQCVAAAEEAGAALLEPFVAAAGGGGRSAGLKAKASHFGTH